MRPLLTFVSWQTLTRSAQTRPSTPVLKTVTSVCFHHHGRFSSVLQEGVGCERGVCGARAASAGAAHVGPDALPECGEMPRTAASLPAHEMVMQIAGKEGRRPVERMGRARFPLHERQ